MRKLASIQKIKDIQPIEKADRIEVATIQGWKVVVPKDQFKVGDYCIYFEIDSLLPDEPRYEFLKKSSWNTRLSKIRLKSVKLRGQISQGLALPLKDFKEINFSTLNEGDDLTEALHIEKYEPVIPASLAGNVRKFSWPISKTDEERIENIPDVLNDLKGKPYYITIKLDGASASFMLARKNKKIKFHVCSRNHSLEYDENNTIWQIAEKYNIEAELRNWYEAHGQLLAIQGEVCGPGIQKNRLNLSEHKLYIFNIVDVDYRKKFPFPQNWNTFRNIPFVPNVREGDSFPEYTLEEIKDMSRGKYKDYIDSAFADQDIEGIVIRSKDQSISFKSINNSFLIKNED